MKFRVAAIFLTALFLILTLGNDAAHAEDSHAGIQKFFGKFVGRSISITGEGLSDRDFNVSISPHEKNGFQLDWTTVIRYTTKEPKVKSYSVKFLPYKKRPGIFYSAMRKNIFGKQAPADPLSGDPYVWAGIDDKTLTVSALYIISDGGYELQIFRRTLTENGMTSRFERHRNGVQQRLIIGELERTAR